MKFLSLIRNEWKELEVKNTWPLLLSIIGLAPAIGLLPPTANIFYGLIICTACYSFYKHKKSLKLCGFILFAFLISIVVASPPPFFKSPLRYFLFLFVFCVASPMFQSEVLRKFRYRVLLNILKICTIIAIVSFVFYFLGINYMVYEGEILDVSKVGGFGGLTKHSMLLAPMSSFALVYICYKALLTKNLWYWFLCIPCAACILFAASRSAFLAGCLGVLTMIYVFAKKKSQLVKICVSLFIVIAVSSPLWNSALNGLKQKQLGNIEAGGMTSSRDSKWNNRIFEFSENPITGIGFCACDQQFIDDYDENTGTIEAGSSWLAVLSMTGLLGFIPFMFLMYRSAKNILFYKTKDSPLLIGLLSTLVIHMFAESYIVAGGSQLCFIAWMIIGCSYDNKYRSAQYYKL